NLIDGQPLSETTGIKPYDSKSGRNYIHWLLATQDSTKLEEEDFGGVAKPSSLLYLLLRHSLLHETGHSIFRFLKKNSVEAPELVRSRKFSNLSGAATVSAWEIFQVPTKELVATEATAQPLFSYLHSPRFDFPAERDVVEDLNEHKQ